jgi:hypothetical protein
MSRTLIAAALLLGSTFAAQARPVDAYYDLIRPNGHPRSHVIHERDLQYCYEQTGQGHHRLDGPAMVQCMLSRGYRHMWGDHLHSYDPPPPEPADVVETPD